MGHFLGGSVRAKLDGLLVRQDRRERIVHAVVELLRLGIELLRVLLEVFEGSQGILVEAVEVLQRDWVVYQLLPEHRGEVPIHSGSRSQVEAQKSSHEFEQLLMRGRVGIWIEGPCLPIETVVHSVVDCLDQKW
jgi:hypothetical protein